MDVSLFGVPLLGQLSRETKRESKQNGGSPQKRHKLKGKVLKSDVNQSLVLSETSAAGSTTTGRGGSGRSDLAHCTADFVCWILRDFW